jgi:hypothetical protein
MQAHLCASCDLLLTGTERSIYFNLNVLHNLWTLLF